MGALLLLLALSGDPLPPQNQPVNITQVSGMPVGAAVPVDCVSGCGGGSGGGGGASWDAGVIVQYPVAVASLWDGGVIVLNFPAIQPVSQASPWVIDVDPDAGPLLVSCVSGCGGGGGGGASWDAGVLVQNFPASFGASQTGNWSVLIEYDGGPLPVAISNFPSTQTITGTVQVLQDSFPWQTLAPPDWDAGVEVLNFPSSFGASQQGPWAFLMVYDGGALPVTGSVSVTFPTVQAVSIVDGGVGASQQGNWAMLMIYDGGSIPVTGAVSVTGSVSVTNLPTVQAVSLVDSGIPGAWDAGYLSYTYAGPLPADTSYQTSCTNGVTFCGTTSTALTACAGGKWQDFQNQSTQSIYICAQAGCSAPTAIDAGTVVGEQVPPASTYFANGSAQYWCVVPTSPQVSPDAGTITKCCK